MNPLKLLVIVCSRDFDSRWCDNIAILSDYMKKLDMQVDYCGISNQDDFINYESIITFKYKIINTKKQFSKICDFITEHRSTLEYDWYMKVRPEVKLLEQINFDRMSETAINARARAYHGPKRIKHGMSINGAGIWREIGDCTYEENEHSIALDDMLFIFHRNIVEMNAFYNDEFGDIEGYWGDLEIEWMQTKVYTNRNIPLNVIGLFLEFTKNNTFSGDINMN